MIVYLADLFHTDARVRSPLAAPYTVPLAIGFMASFVKKRRPDVTFRLFRDPDRFLQALRQAPPDVVGFSVRSWNTDLTRRIAAEVRRVAPAAQMVAGGPSIDDQDEQIDRFLRDQPDITFVVPSEGETGFLALLDHISAGGKPDGTVIPGVAYLDPAGALVRGAYEQPKVPAGEDDLSMDALIPSPYLDGTLDEFLDEGLVPILQTMRGCPYRCEFCVSGTSLWSRPRGFDTDRVKAEIDYVLDRNDGDRLILTDENWGILGDRDVEIAKYILDRYHRTGKPSLVYYYTAKIVNDASRAIVEMIAPIAWIAEFSMSYQTVQPEARQVIKRSNISLDKVRVNADWAHERDILTTSEMIYGFPHETVDSFVDGVETLMRAGIDRIMIYPLQLFWGIELNTRAARENFGIETRYRLADSAYGAYDGGNIVSTEVEEVVVGTKWSPLAGYLQVRRYSFFNFGLMSCEILRDLLNLCHQAGVSTETFARHLISTDYSQYPALQAILAEYDEAVQEELCDTPEEVHASVAETLRTGGTLAGVKLNVIYLGRILSSAAAVRELFQVVAGYVEGLLADNPALPAIRAYIQDVLPHRIVVLSEWAASREVTFESRFDYAAWQRGGQTDVASLLVDRPVPFTGRIPEVFVSGLESQDWTNNIGLQLLLDSTPKKAWLREITPAAVLA